MGFPGYWDSKEPACNVDLGLISGSGRSPGGGQGNPLQQSCQENSRWRSLAGYSPRGCKGLDVLEQLTHTHNRKDMTFNIVFEDSTFYFQICSVAAAAKSLRSCPTLCHPIDGSPPDSPVPGILQARTLEWVAISFPNAWKSKVKVKSLSHVRLFESPWTVAYQAPPSVGFSRHEYWSELPFLLALTLSCPTYRCT